MDSFVRDRLPPRDLWPEMDFSGLPELAYPNDLNCGVELLDRMVETGFADRPVLHFADLSWTYRSRGIAWTILDDCSGTLTK